MRTPASKFAFREAESLFQEAADLPPPAREEFLARRCHANGDLLEEVESLLRHYAAVPATFLSPPRARGIQSVSPPAIPLRIGRYEIIDLIGHGGMGVVYKARQEHPRRSVAVKVIRPELATPETLRRFDYEAAILGRLQHPGIAHVYDAGVADVVFAEGPPSARPYFAMEYVLGEPLNRYLERQQPSLRERLALFLRICEAVEHAHQKGVIHRDLKPGNILVESSGAPKVLDFGVARAIESDAPLTTMHTRVSQLVGTLPYMSPEQVAGQVEQIDTRSDVYSLGVVLYEMLGGRLPYELDARNVAAAARVITECSPMPLGTVNRACRGDLATIVHRALEKDPARRYPSVLALRSDVQHYLSGEPIEARRDSLWHVARKLLARYRLPVGVAAILVLALIATAIVATTLAIERGKLLAQRQLRFNQVRELTRGLLFEVHPIIEKLAGATPARKYLIDSALRYFDSLAQDAGDDPDLIREIAEGYGRLASLQGNPNYVNIGDTEGALQSYQRSADWCSKLLARSRSDPQPRRLISAAYSGMGDILVLQGRADEARTVHESSLETSRELLREQPDSIDFRLDVAIGLIRLASHLERRGAAQDAMTQRLEAVRLLEDAVALDPHQEKALVQLAVACVQVGDSAQANGDASAALQHYHRSLDIRRALFAQAPDNVDYQRSVAISWQRLGNAQVELGSSASQPAGAALESYRQSLAMFEQIAAADVQDVRAARDLSVAHEKVGVIHFKRQDWPPALEHFRANLSAREELTKRHPENTEFESDLVSAHSWIGRTLAAMTDIAPAFGHLEAAVEHAAALHARDAANVRWARSLGAAQFNLAALHKDFAALPACPDAERRGHWQAARFSFTAAQAVFTGLEASGGIAQRDRTVLEKLALEIRFCDQQLAALPEAAATPD